jgi:HAMP domain-containing protein
MLITEHGVPFMAALGLRAKLNAILVPTVGVTLALVVGIDYRHEANAVMAAHNIHVQQVGTTVALSPVDADTTPAAVVTRMLIIHVAGGAIMLVALATAVNLALSHLVLRPLAAIRRGIESMEHGQWRQESNIRSHDEVGEVVRAFGDLGLGVEATMRHVLNTERLATLALLSNDLSRRIEPEAQEIGRQAAMLHGHNIRDVRAAAERIAAADASILAALRALNRPFESRPTQEKRGQHDERSGLRDAG